MVQVNRVCSVGNICLAFKPVTSGTGNQDLEALDQDEHRNGQRLYDCRPRAGEGLEIINA